MSRLGRDFAARPRHRLGCGNGAPFASVLCGREHRQRVLRPVEFVDRRGAGARAFDRRLARWCWPNGRAGWVRTCFIRRTSAAGPAAAPGSRPVCSSAAPIIAAAVVSGRRIARPERSLSTLWDLAHRHGRGGNLADAIGVLLRCFCCLAKPPSRRSNSVNSGTAATAQAKSEGDAARRVVSLVVASAEAQLG